MAIVIFHCATVATLPSIFDIQPSSTVVGYDDATGKNEATDIYINPWVIQKAILNVGSISKKVATKIFNNECLNIHVFGGSITAGKSCCKKTAPKEEAPNPHAAYQHVMIKALNRYSPCRKGMHKMKDTALSGVHTGTWLDLITANTNNVNEDIANSDIIIFETTVNDIDEVIMAGSLNDTRNQGQEFSSILKAKVEIVLRLTKTINPNVTVIWFGASSRNGEWTGEFPRTFGDSNHMIMDVLRY